MVWRQRINGVSVGVVARCGKMRPTVSQRRQWTPLVEAPWQSPGLGMWIDRRIKVTLKRSDGKKSGKGRWWGILGKAEGSGTAAWCVVCVVVRSVWCGMVGVVVYI